MKNPSDDPNMQFGLSKLPPSNIGNNPSLINKSSLLTPNVNISRTFTNTDVDEFLNLIKESNVSLESLHLLLNAYKVKGSGLHKTFKGGADNNLQNKKRQLHAINIQLEDDKEKEKKW